MQTNEPTLYDADYLLWLEKMAHLLKEGRLAELDLPNLAEEVEDMSKSQKQAAKSNLVIVLMHLLKYKYQPDKRSRSWRGTIVEHRRRIKFALEDSPSLKPYLEEAFLDCYDKARQDAATETKLPMSTFPSECPFTFDEAMNGDF